MGQKGLHMTARTLARAATCFFLSGAVGIVGGMGGILTSGAKSVATATAAQQDALAIYGLLVLSGLILTGLAGICRLVAWRKVRRGHASPS